MLWVIDMIMKITKCDLPPPVTLYYVVCLTLTSYIKCEGTNDLNVMKYIQCFFCLQASSLISPTHHHLLYSSNTVLQSLCSMFIENLHGWRGNVLS